MQHIKQKAREMFDERFSPIFENTQDGIFESSYRMMDRNELKSFIDQIIDLAIAERDKEIVEMIEKVEPSPNLEIYLDKVKNGNKDDMYDYGVKITREMIINLINNTKTDKTTK